MRYRILPALAAGALAVLSLTACGSDDDEPTVAGARTSVPSENAAEEPSADASEEPGVPTDLPTDLPSEIPTDIPTEVDLGDECPEVNQVLTDAATAMENMLDDPSAATGLFTQLSTDLRAAAAESNDEVAAAAERVAAVYESLAASLSGSTAPDPAMMTEMTDAATALQQACSG